MNKVNENLVVLPDVKTVDGQMCVWGLNNDVVILDKQQAAMLYLELHKFLKDEQRR